MCIGLAAKFKYFTPESINLPLNVFNFLKLFFFLFMYYTETVQEFPLEEALQTCVSKTMNKTIKTQKPASKKLKPALAQKRRVCSFSGEGKLGNAVTVR